MKFYTKVLTLLLAGTIASSSPIVLAGAGPVIGSPEDLSHMKELCDNPLLGLQYIDDLISQWESDIEYLRRFCDANKGTDSLKTMYAWGALYIDKILLYELKNIREDFNYARDRSCAMGLMHKVHRLVELWQSPVYTYPDMPVPDECLQIAYENMNNLLSGINQTIDKILHEEEPVYAYGDSENSNPICKSGEDPDSSSDPVGENREEPVCACKDSENSNPVCENGEKLDPGCEYKENSNLICESGENLDSYSDPFGENGENLDSWENYSDPFSAERWENYCDPFLHERWEEPKPSE